MTGELWRPGAWCERRRALAAFRRRLYRSAAATGFAAETSDLRKLLLACLFTSLASACAISGADGEGPRYEVCRAQIIEYVETRLDQHVTGIDMDFAERRPAAPTIPPSTGQAVVYVAECDGFHVFDVLGTRYDCLYRAHYGTPPTYVHYRMSAKGCRMK